MASCLLPDFPAVLVALEHLGELDKQLKVEGVPFSSEASHHLREIASAITELEAWRRRVHEHLEVETIETSKLRHQVHKMRDSISQEISVSVLAARQCNTEVLEQLTKELAATAHQQEVMLHRQEVLTRQNAALYPEREQIEAEHDNITIALNYQATQKASRQIQLSQTLERVEDLKASIAAMEQKKTCLLQDLVQERETFRLTQDQLLREIEQTVERIEEQKEENRRQRKEEDVVENVQLDQEDRLNTLTNHLGQLERSIGRLTASQSQCETQLKEELQTHEGLLQEREALEKQLSELRESFSCTSQRLQEDIIVVDSEIVEMRSVFGLSVGSLANVSQSLQVQRREEDETRADHTHISQRLERSKLRLEERITSMVRHGCERRDMEEELRELLDTYRTNKAVFQEACEELGAQLEAERRRGVQEEQERSSLSQQLEEARRQQEKHLNTLTSHINTTRMTYQQLQLEEAELQQHQALSSVIDRLSSQLSQAVQEYTDMEHTHQEEILQYTAEVASVEQSRKEKEKETQQEEARLEEVEREFHQEHKTHYDLTRHTKELKSRKRQLEYSIQALKESTTHLLQPQEQIKSELAAMRAHYLELLANQASELSAVETYIYDNGLKLEQVNMENSRLHLCIAEMTDDITNSRQEKVRHSQEISWLRQEVHALTGHLLEAWAEDLLVAQEFGGGESSILKRFVFLLDQLQSRRLHLGHINSQIHKELLYLTRILDRKDKS